MHTLLIMAGGQSTRMKNPTPKQFLLIGGKPIIIHTLERAEKIEEIEEIIIVSRKEHISKLEKYIEEYNINKKIRFALGGETFQESAYNGLKLVKTKSVIIHDAARPFVLKKDFEKLINHASENVTSVYPIPFTVLTQENEKINGILDRSKLVNIQTPQKFNTKALLESHEKARNENRLFTDQSSILYYYTNTDIATIKGTSYNIKITEPVDMIIGEIIYKENIQKEEMNDNDGINKKI